MIALLKFKSDELYISFTLDFVPGFAAQKRRQKKTSHAACSSTVNSRNFTFHRFRSESIWIVFRKVMIVQETFGPYLSSRVLIHAADMKSSQLRIETTKNYMCQVVFSLYVCSI